MATKPAPTTELAEAQAEFLRLRRILDPWAKRVLHDECAAAIERLKELGMQRPAIAELSKDGGRLKGMQVVSLDYATQRSRERAAGNGAVPSPSR